MLELLSRLHRLAQNALQNAPVRDGKDHQAVLPRFTRQRNGLLNARSGLLEVPEPDKQ